MQLASFGGRRLDAAALVAGLREGSAPGVSRKELAATARLAQEALQLRPSMRLVLGELVASWGEQAWERLLVWPSNAHISRRTGLCERAIRIALRDLMQCGVVIAKDSPNRKRYAIRNAGGTVVDAYGFDLTPLHARRKEFAARVAAQKEERLRIKRAFDAITIARRHAHEAMTALCETRPAAFDPQMQATFDALCLRTPKRCATMPPSDLLDAWMTLCETIETVFFHAGNGGTACRHIEDNKDSSSEACNRDGRETLAPVTTNNVTQTDVDDFADDDIREVIDAQKPAKREGASRFLPKPKRHRPTLNEPLLASASLPMAVAEACPITSEFARAPRNIDEIIALGRYLRPMLGAGEVVWTEAELTLGPLRAALSVIYVTQLYDDDARRHGGESRIRNPGGYLRAFVRMVAARRIDLTADLMAMRRRRLAARKPTTGQGT